MDARSRPIRARRHDRLVRLQARAGHAGTQERHPIQRSLLARRRRARLRRTVRAFARLPHGQPLAVRHPGRHVLQSGAHLFVRDRTGLAAWHHRRSAAALHHARHPCRTSARLQRASR